MSVINIYPSEQKKSCLQLVKESVMNAQKAQMILPSNPVKLLCVCLSELTADVGKRNHSAFSFTSSVQIYLCD